MNKTATNDIRPWKQCHAPASLRRRRLQQERLVAGAAAIDGVERKQEEPKCFS